MSNDRPQRPRPVSVIPPGKIVVRANPHFSPGFKEGVQCGDVLYIPSDMHRRLATLTPEERNAEIAKLTVLFLPALSAAGVTPFLAVPKLNL